MIISYNLKFIPFCMVDCFQSFDLNFNIAKKSALLILDFLRSFWQDFWDGQGIFDFELLQNRESYGQKVSNHTGCSTGN